MSEPTTATFVCATAVWIGLLVAAFTPAPPISPNQHWQPTSSRKFLPRTYRPPAAPAVLARSTP
jgi:hypothetical protein